MSDEFKWVQLIEVWLTKTFGDALQRLFRPVIAKYLIDWLPVNGPANLESFCTFVETFVSTHSPIFKNVDSIKQDTVVSVVIFAAIWTIGADLATQDKLRFEKSIHAIVTSLPAEGSPFDYYLESSSETLVWNLWEKYIADQVKLQSQSTYISTIFYAPYEYWARALLQCGKPFLIEGAQGVGKSALIEFIMKLSAVYSKTLPMQCYGTISSFSDQLVACFEKKTKTDYMPLGNKPITFCTEDIDSVATDEQDSQCTLEFYRFWLEHGGWFDLNIGSAVHVDNVSFVATARLSSKSPSFERLRRRFAVLHMGEPNAAHMYSVVHTRLTYKFQGFAEDIKALADDLTISTLELLSNIQKLCFNSIDKTMPFDFRAALQVVDRMCTINADFYDTSDSVLRLWIHECLRVFRDRLTTSDWPQFEITLKTILQTRFKLAVDNLFDNNALIFSNVVSNSQQYLEVENTSSFLSKLSSKLTTISNVVTSLSLEGAGHITRLASLISAGHVHILNPSGAQILPYIKYASSMAGASVEEIAALDDEFTRKLVVAACSRAVVENQSTVLVFQDVVSTLLVRVVQMFYSDVFPAFFTDEETATCISGANFSDDMALSDQTTLALRKMMDRITVVSTFSSFDSFRVYRQRLKSFVDNSRCYIMADWTLNTLTDLALTEMPEVEGSKMSTLATVCSRIHTISSTQVTVAAVFTLDLFLRFVRMFKVRYETSREAFAYTCTRLSDGVERLLAAERSMDETSGILEKNRMEVQSLQKACDEYLVDIVQQTREAQDQEKNVSHRSEKLRIEESEFQQLAITAESELSRALSAFDAALKGLENINKKDLQELKSYAKPPPVVEKVMEAVLILRKVNICDRLF